jgi:hypothetical protein
VVTVYPAGKDDVERYSRSQLYIRTSSKQPVDAMRIDSLSLAVNRDGSYASLSVGARPDGG